MCIRDSTTVYAKENDGDAGSFRPVLYLKIGTEHKIDSRFCLGAGRGWPFPQEPFVLDNTGIYCPPLPRQNWPRFSLVLVELNAPQLLESCLNPGAVREQIFHGTSNTERMETAATPSEGRTGNKT